MGSYVSSSPHTAVLCSPTCGENAVCTYNDELDEYMCECQEGYEEDATSTCIGIYPQKFMT